MGILGSLMRMGIESDGDNVKIFRGTLSARNILTPSGDVWYVNKNNTTTGTGKSWKKAFKTITEALAAAGNYDTILIEEGVYDEGAVLNITQTGLRIFGMGTSGDLWGTTTIKASAADHKCITVNANQVEIGNLAFVQNNANAIIDVATTTATYKTHIHDCYFGGSNTQTYGVCGGITGAGNDCVDTIVERCTFLNCVVGALLYGTRCEVRDCMFYLAASGVGISVSQNSGDRPYFRAIGNKITGVNSGDTGILISNTPTEGLMTLLDNRVVNCATPITVSKYTSWYSNNYFGVRDHLYHPNPRDAKNGFVMNDIWYVDASITTAGDGRCWASAFKTITAAITAAGDNDVIKIAGGDYDEGAAIAITENGLRFEGADPCENGYPVLIYSSAASHHIITVNANNVEIRGVGIVQTKDNYNGIVIAGTSTSYKLLIENCKFDGWGTGEYAIKCDATQDQPDLTVQDCLFRSWATACIYADATRGLYRRNIFHVAADTIGLEHIPNGGDRPDNVIVDNIFNGVSNASTTGIKFTGTPSNGTIVCARNIFGGTFNTTITQMATWAGIENYAASADGGGLIDTVT